MVTILAAIAAVAAVLGLTYAYLFPQEVPRRTQWQALLTGEWRPVLAFAAGTVVALFLLSLPTGKPFSPGLTLGWGILIGGLVGLYAWFEASGSFAGEAASARTVGLLSAAALGPAATLLILRGYPNEALMGCAGGAVLVAAIGWVIVRPREDGIAAEAAPTTARSEERGVRSESNGHGVAAEAAPTGIAPTRAAKGLEVFALATAAVCAGCVLAIHHFPRAHPGHVAGGYWALPALAMAAAALTVAIVSGARPGGRWGPLLRALAPGAVVVVLVGALGSKLLPKLDWDLPLYGLVAFGFIVATLAHGEEAEGARPVGLTFAAVLLVLATVAVAFRRLHGYGECLALLAGLPVAAVTYLGGGRARDSVTGPVAMGAASILLLLTLSRLFVERAQTSWALDFQQHYDCFAVVLGIGACFALMAFAARGVQQARAGRSPAAQIPRAIFLGLTVGLVPLALAALWGAKAVNAFLIGLVFAQATWMLLAAWTVGGERRTVLAGAPQVLSVAAILIAIQLGPHVLELELARGVKLIIAAAITVGAVIWVLADGRRRLPGEGEGDDGTAA